MAGSEQRPTDEVEGHGYKLGQDTEAVDEDRGGRIPDDAEGHGGGRWGGQDTEAVDEDQVGDDTEGHSGKRA